MIKKRESASFFRKWLKTSLKLIRDRTSQCVREKEVFTSRNIKKKKIFHFLIHGDLLYIIVNTSYLYHFIAFIYFRIYFRRLYSFFPTSLNLKSDFNEFFVFDVSISFSPLLFRFDTSELLLLRVGYLYAGLKLFMICLLEFVWLLIFDYTLWGLLLK